MDADVLKVHMQNLEQYVLDENKIVTSKWLSTNLSVHISAAKKLMNEFVRDQRSNCKNTELAITYFISGILKDKKGLASTIVSENDLPDFKETLESVLSEHIYSLHKSSTVDFNGLYLAGQCEELCSGVIKNDSVSKRNLKELSSLRLGAYPASAAPVGKFTQKNNTLAKEKPAISKEPESRVTNQIEKVSTNKPTTPKNGDVQKKDVSANKGKNSITGFFSKQSSSPKIVKVVPKTELERSSEKTTENKSNKTEKSKGIPFPKVEKVVIKNEKTSPVKKTEEVKSLSKSKSSLSTKNKKENGKAKISKSTKEPSKKRKRIQCFDSDSEKDSGSDDDIFKSSSPEHVNNTPFSDDEDVIPPTPEVVKPIASKLSLNSRKRKKLVDKTYMKDDGFILTVKEEVYESCSDEDVVEEPKKVSITKPSPQKVENNENKKPNNAADSKNKAKKKTSPLGQSKQSSLMSFFTKK